MGRTLGRHARVYSNGYDLSGYTRSIGPLGSVFEEVEQVSLLDGAKGVLLGKPEIQLGTLNALFDNTATSGIHALLNSPVAQQVLVAVGIAADPIAGDPVFMTSSEQLAYQAAPSGSDLALSIPYGKSPVTAGLNYTKPWGVLLHANAAKTGANTGTGVDDFGAESTAGGWMMYHILAVAGTGSLVVSIDDSANNSSFSALSGATSGSIVHGGVPASGIVQLGTTATVRRYLRWQLALTDITSCTFVLGFVRG
jgi:hypothetical protein